MTTWCCSASWLDGADLADPDVVDADLADGGPADRDLADGRTRVEPGGLWHVTVTVGGSAQPTNRVLAALERLAGERPFLLSGRYGADRAELRYWEEAVDCADAAALALRLWAEHRISAGLPPWTVVGLDVVAAEEYQRREPAVLVPAGGWRPF